GHKTTDAYGAPDIPPPTDLSTGGDHSLCELRDCQHVLISFGRQPAHEVELDLPPALRVGSRNSANQVIFSDHLVDHFAHPLGAALGRESQSGAPSIAGQLVCKIDIERVHSGTWQRQRNVGALITIG